MIDNITAKIKKYPFQTGVILGFLVCLILVGFIGLFQDNGKSLAGNKDIIREDYLRMTINEYGEDQDGQLAGWRYKHLGSAADSTLELMQADESISPQLLAAFAQAVNKKEMLLEKNYDQSAGTPASPRKGLSGFGKTILVIFCLIAVCAGGFYVASLIKTKQKQKKRTDQLQNFADEPMNVITPEKVRMADSDVPDTLFDLDDLFPKSSENDAAQDLLGDLADVKNTQEEPQTNDGAEAVQYVPVQTDSVTAEMQGQTDLSEEENVFTPIQEEAESEAESVVESEINEDGESSDPVSEQKSVFDVEPSVHDMGDFVREEPENAPVPVLDENTESVSETERPLVETDEHSEPNNDDELLKMIRGAQNVTEEPVELSEPEADPATEQGEQEEIEHPAYEIISALKDTEEEQEKADDILIHYQSTYRIGNDMYDEVFSIDQGDSFRGECGIGIGETLNNTEPKAVTAFEVWLFDKDDIHTATWYLVSDFALSNEGILSRLQQHGRCEQIKNNGIYVLETETLRVEIKVLDLEYGSEMDEKNSYFTGVTFDVVARSKDTDINE